MMKNKTIKIGKVENTSIDLVIRIQEKRNEEQKQDRRAEHGKIFTVEYERYGVGEGKYY